jgi:hypothetical protein
VPALLGAASERWAAAAAAPEGSLGSASGLVIISVLAAACDEEELLSSLRPLQPLDSRHPTSDTHDAFVASPGTGHGAHVSRLR